MITPILPASGHGEVAGLVEELRALLPHIPSGQWRAEPTADGMADMRLYAPAPETLVGKRVIANVAPSYGDAVAHWLRLCSPDNIAKLLDHIEALAAQLAGARKLADGYGIVLTMISAGCSDPKRFATRMLAEYDQEAKALGIVK